MTRPRLLFVVAAAALGLAYGALAQRAVGLLGHLESAELDASGRALRWIVAPLAAVIAFLLVDRPSSPRRTALLTVGGGGLAGLLAGAAPLAANLARPGGLLLATDLAALGAGFALGLLLALPALPLLAGLQRAAEAARERALGIAGGVGLLVGGALLATAPRPPAPELALRSHRPTEPKVRGVGEVESESERRVREVMSAVDRIVAAGKGATAPEVEQAILAAERQGLLEEVFANLVDRGLYDGLARRLRELPRESRALAALVATRPTYGVQTLNADTVAAIKTRRDWLDQPYGLLIVPGYTPIKANKPLPIEEIDAAVARLKLAASDWQQGLGGYVLVSGGSVHPAGTPHNEALSMRDYLIKLGVPPDRILVDPFARHSTTNLRNAGRLMRELKIDKALIVTGFESSPFDQAFYFGYPVLSTFASRSRRELGFMVGALERKDAHHIEFVPAPEVARTNPHDPLDA